MVSAASRSVNFVDAFTDYPFRGNIVEVVIEPSVLAETSAAHLQYDLSSRRSFEIHRTRIYSPCELLCLDEKCTLNKSTPGIVLRKERYRPPNGTS